MSQSEAQKQTLREWLLTDTPQSRHQARMVALYQGWLSFSTNTMAMFGLGILICLGLVALFAPLISPHDPFAQELGNRLQPLWSEGHVFGTDSLGRDILSRLIYGSRITLYIVALVALIAPVAGLLVGTVAGYSGGWLDVILMRITDIFLAFPRLVLALAFVAALGAGIENAVLAISLTAWPPYARIARAETLTIRNSDYISAVKLQGAGATRIVTKHIWPLCISSLIVRVTLDMAGIILAAAGLGFLGLGAQPPSPEWGAMISEGRRFILDHWWVATIPGLAIFTVSLAFNLLGDGLRDVLDPKDGGS
ncbi:nickel transporter permease [Pseudohalocynthiibacter aestuariivivens]|jgi:peptide/nickel transport system permease protein|uniref:Nickel transporter permease n=1 Tax=Pseudohalocynthiibacter aestuariivivens TaxID=1591409 RepID=A0ABV5J9W2_9RHOB|nr:MULTISPECIES: nickel transporter permease [Pseudohalocynthiibacter]MBS9716813.1 ABC transporter permease [Pseudohalocynthiibacter aestuariivivens]MCK0102094.1 ABC transporter permease [Pseudohalocynthiibacter sp. F2068]